MPYFQDLFSLNVNNFWQLIYSTAQCYKKWFMAGSTSCLTYSIDIVCVLKLLLRASVPAPLIDPGLTGMWMAAAAHWWAKNPRRCFHFSH